MSWFQLALILHIIGILILISAIALQLTGVFILRGAQSIEQVRVAGNIFRRLPPLFGTATVLIILSGLYMMLRIHEYGWTTVSLVVVVVMAALGSSAGKKNDLALKKELAKGGSGVMSKRLQQLALRTHLLNDTVSGLYMVAALVIIMIVKPSVVASIIILLVAVVLGQATVPKLAGKSKVIAPKLAR